MNMDFIETNTGRKFFFLEPKPEDFDIKEIAHALSLLCRFGGHCLEFYSVAEHSVRCAWTAEDWGLSRELQLEALLHDGTEAYLVDMPRPIKYCMKEYMTIEEGIDKPLRQKFGLPEKMSPEVKKIDNTLLMTERRDIMTPTDNIWTTDDEPLPNKIRPWSSEFSRLQFLKDFERLTA